MPTIDKSLSYSTAMCQRRMATFGLEASTYCTVQYHKGNLELSLAKPLRKPEGMEANILAG